MLISFPECWLLMDLGGTLTGGSWVLGTRGAESQWPHLTEIKTLIKGHKYLLNYLLRVSKFKMC